MIIVKTKNGDRFINDKAVTMVEHDREKAVVIAYRDDGASYNINDVEGITKRRLEKSTFLKKSASIVLI